MAEICGFERIQDTPEGAENAKFPVNSRKTGKSAPETGPLSTAWRAIGSFSDQPFALELAALAAQTSPSADHQQLRRVKPNSRQVILNFGWAPVPSMTIASDASFRTALGTNRHHEPLKP